MKLLTLIIALALIGCAAKPVIPSPLPASGSLNYSAGAVDADLGVIRTATTRAADHADDLGKAYLSVVPATLDHATVGVAKIVSDGKDLQTQADARDAAKDKIIAKQNADLVKEQDTSTRAGRNLFFALSGLGAVITIIFIVMYLQTHDRLARNIAFGSGVLFLGGLVTALGINRDSERGVTVAFYIMMGFGIVTVIGLTIYALKRNHWNIGALVDEIDSPQPTVAYPPAVQSAVLAARGIVAAAPTPNPTLDATP